MVPPACEMSRSCFRALHPFSIRAMVCAHVYAVRDMINHSSYSPLVRIPNPRSVILRPPDNLPFLKSGHLDLALVNTGVHTIRIDLTVVYYRMNSYSTGRETCNTIANK